MLGFGVIVLAALPLPGARTRPGVYLSSALADPLRDFFARYRSAGGLILSLICLYRIPDFVLNIMNPFYLDLGYSLVEIAEVRKIFGVGMTMFGVFAGGVAVARYGLLRAMVIGAFAGPLSNLLFIWLAMQGHSLFALFAAIGLDNVAGGFAGTCLIAYMSSLTSAGFTATQYALFSSLYAIPGRLIASQSGRIVEGAARLADAGGVLSGLKGFFAGQAPEKFRHRPRAIGRHARCSGHRLCGVLCVFCAHRRVRRGALLCRAAPASAGAVTIRAGRIGHSIGPMSRRRFSATRRGRSTFFCGKLAIRHPQRIGRRVDIRMSTRACCDA